MTPQRWAVVGGSIWVESEVGAPTLIRIDAASAKIGAETTLPYLGELVAGDGGLWLLGPLVNAGPAQPNKTLSRVDLATGELTKVATIEGASDLAVGLGSVFVVQGDHLLRLDPKTGDAVATLPVPAFQPIVACGDLFGWAADSDPANNELLRIDPASGAIIWRQALVSATHRIREVAGECWDLGPDQLTRVWPTGLGVSPSVGAGLIQAAGDAFWVWPWNDSLQRFNPYLATVVGRVWTVDPQDRNFNAKVGNDSQLLAAGGALWLINAYELVRFDISTVVPA